jgi:hypothetical protein
MTRRQHPLVAVEPDALPELRAATRDAHEATQQLRKAAADVRQVLDAAEAVRGAAVAELRDYLREQAREAMRELGAELERGRDQSLDRIEKTMDNYWRLMLGEAPEQRRREGDSVGELLQRRIVAPLDDVRGRIADLERRLNARGLL